MWRRLGSGAYSHFRTDRTHWSCSMDTWQLIPQSEHSSRKPQGIEVASPSLPVAWRVWFLFPSHLHGLPLLWPDPLHLTSAHLVIGTILLLALATSQEVSGGAACLGHLVLTDGLLSQCVP